MCQTRKLLTPPPGLIVVFLALISLTTAGCGSDDGAGGSLEATATEIVVSLSAPGSGVAGLALKGQETTEDQLVVGGEATVYLANPGGGEDLEVGTCTTGPDGTCPIPTDTATLGDDPQLFVSSDSGIAAMESPGDVAAGSTIEIDANSVTTLTVEAYRDQCADALGSAPTPGAGISNCIAHVIPSCMRAAMEELMGTGANVDPESVAGEFNAILVGFRTAFAAGAPPDMRAVFGGDTTAIANFEQAAGASIPATAALKAQTTAVDTGDAAGRAATVLDNVVDCLCDAANPEARAAFSEITAAEGGIAEGSRFNMFAQSDPTAVGTFDPTAFRQATRSVITIEGGASYIQDPRGALALVELYRNGGITATTSAEEFQRNMGTMMAAGIPGSRAAAAEIAIAGMAVIGTPGFSGLTPAQAVTTFGAAFLGDPSIRNNVMVGGTATVEGLVNANGGFASMFTAVGNAQASGRVSDGSGGGVFAPPVACGGTCGSTTGPCQPPASCVNGTCAVSSGTCAQVTGTCASNNDCPSGIGMICGTHLPTPHCILAAGLSEHFLDSPIVTGAPPPDATGGGTPASGTTAPPVAPPLIEIPTTVTTTGGAANARCRDAAPRCDTGLSCTLPTSPGGICQPTTFANTITQTGTGTAPPPMEITPTTPTPAPGTGDGGSTTTTTTTGGMTPPM